MFTWHEVTRRRICRLAFAALAILPTSVVLLAAAWLRLPQSVAFARASLADRLALDVSVAGVRYPRPQIAVYEQLALSDPESGQLLARFAALEVDESDSVTRITCSQPDVDVTRPELIGELATRRMRWQAGQQKPLEVLAPQLTLHLLGSEQTLGPLRARFELTADGPQAIFLLRTLDDPTAKPSRLKMRRRRLPAGAVTTIDLDTGPNALAGDLVAMLFTGSSVWGTGTSFAGILHWTDGPQGQLGEMSGRLVGFDLDRLVTERFGRKLSGPAELICDYARLQNGRWTAAQGKLNAGPGLVSRQLLTDAVAYLKARSPGLPSRPGELVAYQQMGLAFRLNENGIQILGTCLGVPPGTMLAEQNGRSLLLEPLGDTQSPLGLIRALAGPGNDRVPTSPAAQSLLGMLPVPAAAPEPVLEARQRAATPR